MQSLCPLRGGDAERGSTEGRSWGCISRGAVPAAPGLCHGSGSCCALGAAPAQGAALPGSLSASRTCAFLILMKCRHQFKIKKKGNTGDPSLRATATIFLMVTALRARLVSLWVSGLLCSPCVLHVGSSAAWGWWSARRCSCCRCLGRASGWNCRALSASIQLRVLRLTPKMGHVNLSGGRG